MMAAKRVWVAAPTGTALVLSCGHTSVGNGYPTPSTGRPPRAGDDWYCEQCALHSMAQLDQELAAAAEQIPER
jgi:hypothetical protein